MPLFLFLVSFFLVTGLSKIAQLLFNKKQSKQKGITITNALVNFITGFIILLFPKMSISLFAYCFGIYVLALSFTHGANYLILRKNKVKGRWIELFVFLFYLAFAIFLGFIPYLHINVIMNVIATYFILYGIFYYKDLIVEMTPMKQKDHIKRHIRISLPVFLQALLPKFVLDEVNEFLIPSDQKEIDARSDFSQYKVAERADVEIYIHASNKGFGKVGHVDICIDNQFLSYGNYDSESVRFNELIGDGVLINAYKEEYIPFVIKDSEKTLFCFGLKLNALQKERVQKQLSEIKKLLYPWQVPTYKGKDLPYAARLLQECPDTAFYKFKKGRFKTYFVATTNCVQLADYIVGSAGLDILNMNGIVTPGAYYEYLERQFALNNQMVIYKKIYN
ncbi:MAG: DUF308 domain-containing protein [Erysipelotrichia bacterium]|nr:DUF308 domain-containing protein [Erysipelotrichia bacterium]